MDFCSLIKYFFNFKDEFFIDNYGNKKISN